MFMAEKLMQGLVFATVNQPHDSLVATSGVLNRATGKE